MSTTLGNVVDVEVELAGLKRLRFALMREYRLTEARARNVPLRDVGIMLMHLQPPGHAPALPASGRAASAPGGGSLEDEILGAWARAAARPQRPPPGSTLAMMEEA